MRLSDAALARLKEFIEIEEATADNRKDRQIVSDLRTLLQIYLEEIK